MERIYAVDLYGLAPAPEFTSFGQLVSVIVQNATVIAGIICFILIVLGGFAVITGAGGGDSKKLQQGQKTITGAIAGLIIVVASVWLMEILGKISGLPVFEAMLGNP